MPVFLERFLLPVTAAVTVMVVFTNPMGFDWQQRMSGGLVLLFAAYFIGHTLHKRNEGKTPSVGISTTLSSTTLSPTSVSTSPKSPAQHAAIQSPPATSQKGNMAPPIGPDTAGTPAPSQNEGSPSSMRIDKIDQKVGNGSAIVGVQGNVTVNAPSPQKESRPNQ